MKVFKSFQMVTLCVLLSLPLLTTPLKAQDSTSVKGAGHVFGEAFGDYYYKLGGDVHNFSTAQYAPDQKDFNAFDIRRIYLGYDYSFHKRVSATVMMAHEGDVLPDGNRSFYLKVARLKINNVIPRGNLIVGQTSTPTFAMFTEKIWGYRSIERTILDMRGLGIGADLGVQLEGNFTDEGNVGYIVMVSNGTGAHFENNKYKKLYGEVHARLMDRHLLLEGYLDYQGGANHTSTTTLKAFVGYQVPTFTVGLTGVKQLRNNAIAPGVDDNPGGFSLFAHGVFIEHTLSGFIRYDFYNPDRFSNYNESFEVMGVDYHPFQNIHFMPNIWVNGYSAQNNAPHQKADLVGRITFYYNF